MHQSRHRVREWQSHQPHPLRHVLVERVRARVMVLVLFVASPLTLIKFALIDFLRVDPKESLRSRDRASLAAWTWRARAMVESLFMLWALCSPRASSWARCLRPLESSSIQVPQRMRLEVSLSGGLLKILVLITLWMFWIDQFSSLGMVWSPEQLAGLICMTQRLGLCRSMSWVIQQKRLLCFLEERPCENWMPSWPTRTTSSSTRPRTQKSLHGLQCRCSSTLLLMFQSIWRKRHMLWRCQISISCWMQLGVARRTFSWLRLLLSIAIVFSWCLMSGPMRTCSIDWALWLKGFITYVIRQIMEVHEACAADDPHRTGFPCFQKHKGKARNNQYGSWSTCMRCGLRLSYQAAKGFEGHYRQMGPPPQLIQVAILDNRFYKIIPSMASSEQDST